MICFNVLKHDMVRGLGRWRYLIIVALSCFPLAEFNNLILPYNTTATWMDAVFYLFKGTHNIYVSSNIMEKVEVPVLWLLILGSSLVINIDYPHKDLYSTGQQVIIRCRRRKLWYVSKFVWNVASSILFFCLVMISAALYTVISGNILSVSPSTKLLEEIYYISTSRGLTNSQTVLIGLVLPFLSILALNTIQFTLSFYFKPILATLCCIGICILSIFTDSSFVLGNGAMTLRTASMILEGESVSTIILTTMGVCVLCLAIGLHRFGQMDILQREE